MNRQNHVFYKHLDLREVLNTHHKWFKIAASQEMINLLVYRAEIKNYI